MEYVIDGRKIRKLCDFWDVISWTLIPGACWGRNFDALNDILRGGFGTPEDVFVLRWRHWPASRRALGRRDFDMLVEIIRTHGPGEEEAEDNVTLILESPESGDLIQPVGGEDAEL